MTTGLSQAFRLVFAYTERVFDPDSNLPRLNRSLVYLGACVIAGLRLARQGQVNIRQIPTREAVAESVELAHEMFYAVFRRIPPKLP